ncbi:DUF3310 domain-containing protein [Fimbriimonas ginsengisoli]|uniref:DUF3310 domain-containing protein n=1 Tax=Fimbriimonas ginsengisoli Gsoil 348 TaxID=661478 RepID=A0A068NL65_FIMGI|nr:DUF3310 domain-containing protein [Fimbriimonas ginsengisoli]AIE83505.1 hypothetical protein OP10G_0137 [Fimbriimonas ginsengisoli Gsoil 348]
MQIETKGPVVPRPMLLGELPKQIEAPAAPENSEPINPAHYRGDDVMCIIERYRLGFCLGNVAKYVLRHADKAGVEDLKKARWYLDRAISNMEKGEVVGL